MTLKPYHRFIRLLFTIFLTLLIIRKVDYLTLKNTLSNIRVPYALLGLLFFVLHDFLKVTKWRVLLQAKAVNIPFFRLMQLDYTSRFMSLFVPSSISVDVFRGYGLSRQVTSVSVAASSIIVDRFLGLLALLAIVNFSTIVFYDVIKDPTITSIGLILLIVLIVLIFLFTNDSMETKLNSYKKIIDKYSLLQRINGLRLAIRAYKNHGMKILWVFFLSLAMQLFRVTIYYFVNLAVNAQISFKYFFIFTPAVVLIAMLPLSLVGIGLREGSFVYFYSKIGVSPTAAFAVPALVSAMVIISTLPGGLFLALTGLTVKKEPSHISSSSWPTDKNT